MTPLPPPSGRSGPPSGRAQFFAIFPSIMLPVFLAVVDQTIVATALPGIAGELGHVDRVAWVVIAYLMAVTIASPVYGRLGDMLGRRRLMFVALVVSMTGSVVCALAPNIEVLVAARVVQGLGGGGLLTLTQALIGEAIQARDRARYQGFLAAIAMTSNTFGPVVGGILTQHFGWRSVFLVNLPVGLIAVFLTSRLPARKGTGEAFRFDAPGLMLFTSFAISVLVMLQYLQQVRFEAIPIILALLVLAVVSALLLVWREARAHSPLFPPDVVRNPSVWRCDGLAACHGALLVSLITFSPIYLRVVHGVSIAQAGLLLLPMTVSLAIGSLTTGRIVSRTGHTAILPSWGMVIVACTILLLALVANHLPTLGFAAILAFTAMFMGTVMAVVQVTVQVSAGPGMLGTAAASVQLSRALGASLGTAIIGATLFIAMRVTDADAARLMAELLQSGPDALLAWPEAGRAALQVEIGDAFRLGFLVMGIFAVMASILAWTLPTRDI